MVKVAIPQRLGSNPPRNAIRFSGGESINNLSHDHYDRVGSRTQPISLQAFSCLKRRAAKGHHARMNPTSLAFAPGMAALVAVTGGFIDWGAGKYGGWSARKRRTARRPPEVNDLGDRMALRWMPQRPAIAGVGLALQK